MTDSWRVRVRSFLRRLDENYEGAGGSGHDRGSRWNRLLERISDQIREVMRQEILRPPGEPAYIPPEYLLLLSPSDEAELRGDKRTGFLRGLRNATTQAAKSLIGDCAQTESLFVQIRTDGSLSTDEFVVKAIWEVAQEPTQVGESSSVSRRTVQAGLLEEETRVSIPARGQSIAPRWVIIHDPDPGLAVREQIINADGFKIGRGGKKVHVDLALPDDLEISRHHLTLQMTPAGEITVEVVGRNPIQVGTKEFWPGELARWDAGDLLVVGKYRLELRPIKC